MIFKFFLILFFFKQNFILNDLTNLLDNNFMKYNNFIKIIIYKNNNFIKIIILLK